jgi:UDP-N-acetyl-D-galactosamine dehydrogenase
VSQAIAVIGLGYVGCPLAFELAKRFDVIGIDINEKRVTELVAGYDRTNELTQEQVLSARWELTTEPSHLRGADVVIVTVPTPITEANVPDLTPVIKATETIAAHLQLGQVVVYESTVYPGVTEDICVPILERISGLKWKRDFFVAYSPERINPGDKVNTLTSVTKIVSGDTSETLDKVDAIYSAVTKTHRAESIKVAEAAKVIENTQRDVNIALMNELSAIFSRLHIDTHDVIKAASTKWNFLRFYPGLVGGHCISVDPYYLTHRAQEVGYIPSLILAAREVNDQMPAIMAFRTLQELSKAKRMYAGTVVTILGCTFKENVPDIRNSKVFAMAKDLRDWGLTVQLVDPMADAAEVLHEYGVQLTAQPDPAHAVILAVNHDEYVAGGWDMVQKYAVDSGSYVVTDMKAVLDRDSKPENAVLVRA